MENKLANLCDHLHCEACGKDAPVPACKIGDYIKNGWPVCCGLTMTLITKMVEQNK
jgi:hypothetical protein